jgi:K+ transporter
MTNQERDGQFFLRFMFALWIVIEVILITYSASKRGAGEFVFGGVRLALTIGLMYALMRGKSWAKWVFVALLVVTSALLGFSLLLNPNVIIFCLTAYLVVLLYALLFSARVKAYLHLRKNTHRTLDEGGAV